MPSTELYRSVSSTTRLFGRDLIYDQIFQNIAAQTLCGMDRGIGHKTHFRPSTADGRLFANDNYTLVVITSALLGHTQPCEPNAFASNSFTLLSLTFPFLLCLSKDTSVILRGQFKKQVKLRATRHNKGIISPQRMTICLQLNCFAASVVL